MLSEHWDPSASDGDVPMGGGQPCSGLEYKQQGLEAQCDQTVPYGDKSHLGKILWQELLSVISVLTYTSCW